ncbi:hypothetical protein [Curtobacterium citreum]|uniref:hypothetical protein n=1 Tax=Curtobacterium citreum TaxID=2036 RepID=UPI0020276607|nr:hypothetical protein [Curtobacterium albidum]
MRMLGTARRLLGSERSRPDRDGAAADLVRGADDHAARVRSVVVKQAVISLGVALFIGLLLAFNEFSAGAAQGPIGGAVRTEPTSGANVMAAYALLSGLLFALQVSVRSLNKESDLTEQIDAAEAGRRRTVAFLAVVAGMSAFWLCYLCLWWFARPGDEIDLLRILGPVGASIVLAVVSAETFVAAELPDDPILRRAVQQRNLTAAVEARGRLPSGGERAAYLRAVLLISLVSVSCWLVWWLVAGQERRRLIIGFALVALSVTIGCFFTTISAVVAVARRQVLDGVMVIVMPVLILVVYGGTTWLALATSRDAADFGDAYGQLVGCIVVFLGPPALIALVSVRGQGDGLVGVVIVFAARRLDRAVERADEALGEVSPRRTASPSLVAAWFFWLPVVPQLLLRVAKAGGDGDEHPMRLRIVAALSWTCLAVYCVVLILPLVLERA